MPRQRDKVAHGRRAARKGNVHDAERLYREAIAEGDSYGYNNLAQLLIEEAQLDLDNIRERDIRQASYLLHPSSSELVLCPPSDHWPAASRTR